MKNNFENYIHTYGKGTTNIGHNQYITIDVMDIDVIYSKDCNGNIWHRLDGPAYIYFNGATLLYENSQWYINDHDITEKIQDWAKENSIDLDNLTDEDKALIKLFWADY